MNFKNVDAPESTETFNREKIDSATGNIYESIVAIANRSKQINEELKTELNQKLEEFSSINENLEEVFENREQIEVSKFYEKLPKPTSVAIKEWLDGKIEVKNETSDL